MAWVDKLNTSLYNRFSVEGRINQVTTAAKTEYQQLKNSPGQYLLNKAIEADPIAGSLKRTKDAVETVKRVGSGIAHGNTDAIAEGIDYTVQIYAGVKSANSAGTIKPKTFNAKKPFSNEHEGMAGKEATKGSDIVGSSYNEVLPTQDYINPLKVAEYKSLIQGNAKIPASEAYKVGGKIYLEEGHHRFVAHMQLGVKPPLIIRNTEGPVGYSGWMNTTYQLPPLEH